MIRILVLIFIITPSLNAISQNKKVEDFGVEISFSATREIFPETWLTEEINGKASPLDTVEFNRSTAIIIKALNKYPVELVRKHLTKVFVIKELEFYGLGYGGTNSSSAVYITNNGKDNGYTDSWLEQAFHHEFSSILLRNYSFLFDMKKWISFNKNIHYGQDGTEAIKQGKESEGFDFELNKKGVLSEYGKASIEEDFNSFAENLFLSSTGFWEIGKTHKRIRKKAEQIIEFYNNIDATFNEAYFRAVSKK